MIVTLCNQKGGAGKTTLTLLLAMALESIGRSVAVIDRDPQETSSRALNYLREHQLTNISTTKQAEGFDVTFIDTPPRLDEIVASAVRASDRVILVSSPSPADLWSTQQSRDFVSSNLGSETKMALLFNSVVRMARISRDDQELESLAKNVGLPALKNFLTRRQAYQYAVLQGWGALRGMEKYEVMNVAVEIATM